ncbi:hypothetical protein ACJMK2_011525 [Sinanodonta woodiana]|uniref:N-acetylglucosaminylphosphatidylinositol deacetylase n=1 Tax=Sinanodonta woodiana TaxID=1069815 RepID=A0ABD3V7Q4_SINWO
MDSSTDSHNLNFRAYIIHFIGFILFVYVVICLYIVRSPLAFNDKLHKVILFTAHPDDECMFFTPTILHFLQEGSVVYLTCFSSGNFYRLAEVRRKELHKSCQVLGIDKRNLQILNESHFPDDPATDWNVKDVSDVMLEAVNRTQSDIIVTFDNGGVSGHRNHISLYNAARHLVETKRLNEDIKVLVLETTSTFRKYLFGMDLPLSYLTADIIMVSSVLNYITGWRAMLKHWTQMEWFRWLYLMFSRYMIVNTLKQITNHCSK